jgi:ABC-type polysaccharide/polyol phosphate export permease
MDTAHLATPARVALFALAGVLLIVGAFLYMKFKERFEEHA